MNHKLSVVVLTYKRPENCQKIVSTYETYGIIDEILVASNDGFVPQHNELKTKVFLTHNQRGAYERFFVAIKAKNEFIFMTDDDFLVSEDELKVLFNHALIDHEKIHGYFGRNLICSIFYGRFFDGKEKEVDIVLPGLSIITRQMCNHFLPFINTKPIRILKKINHFFGFNESNGEDILFALLVKRIKSQKHSTHTFQFSSLENKTGSISKRGLYFRFCRNMAVLIGLFLQNFSFFFAKNKIETDSHNT